MGTRRLAAAARRRRDRVAGLPQARPAHRRRHPRAQPNLAARAWLADTLAGKRSLLVVDTNEQAARLCAQLRADLVRLGRVERARRAARPAGHDRRRRRPRAGPPQRLGPAPAYEGNRRGPINRETYRVLDTRDDGGLVVAADHRPATDGVEQLGERMMLPAATSRRARRARLRRHRARRQGLTVDTSHTVVTPRTGRAALYVALTRGADANTAHVTTQAAPEDAPDRHRQPDRCTATRSRCSPAASNATTPELAALVASRDRTAAEAASLRTAAELFADAAELAATERTALCSTSSPTDGAPHPGAAGALAAEDGTVSLTRVLRRAETRRPRPRARSSATPITSRPLGDARSLTTVIHHRITDTTDLDPVGDRYTDWTPQVDNPAWQRHLDRLAAAADTRRDQLGRTRRRAPRRMGGRGVRPRPRRPARARRVDGAGRRGRRAPRTHRPRRPRRPSLPGAAESRAGRGLRLLPRRLARARPRRSQPRRSRDERRPAPHARPRLRARTSLGTAATSPTNSPAPSKPPNATTPTASIRAAEAATETDADRRGAARNARPPRPARLAETLDQRAAELERADDARARWYAHTAATRAAEQRARDELAARGVDPDQPEQHHHRRAVARRAPRRPSRRRPAPASHRRARPRRRRRAAPPDLAAFSLSRPRGSRDEPARHPRQATREPDEPTRDEQDWTRVPSADETADRSPVPNAPSPNSATPAPTTSAGPTRKHARATRPLAPTTSTAKQKTQAARPTIRPPFDRTAQPAAACGSCIGGRREPCHVHSNVAATPCAHVQLRGTRRHSRQILRLNRLRHRRMPPARHRRRRHLRSASDARPHRLIRQPTARPKHANQKVIRRARLTRPPLDSRPDRAELGPGHPQVLTRHLREGLGRHLHATQRDTAHRHRSSPYDLPS